MEDIFLGAHFSIAGGLHKAFDHADTYNCSAMQIFTQNSNTWKVRKLDSSDIDMFKERKKESGVKKIIAHAGYLINPAGPDLEKREKSYESLKGDFIRASQLGIKDLVIHPGSHLKTTIDEGVKRAAQMIKKLFSENEDHGVKILFETTAGQGDCVGHRLEHIEEIISIIDNKERTGICIDTCHVYAAGYEINDKDNYESFFSEVESRFSLESIGCLHLNDSKKGLGSRVDRHDHIGKGEIGKKAFEFIMADKRLESIPKIIETPGFDDKKDMNKINFKKLLSMVKENG